MNLFVSLRTYKSLLSLALLATSTAPSSMAEPTVKVGGAGWIQSGRIQKSSDTMASDVNGRFLYTSGAQGLLTSDVSEKLSAAVGVGIYWGHTLSGSVTSSGGYAPTFIAPYVAEANFTYKFINEEDSKLHLRGGHLFYNYNPEVQNLGLYLLRGPVYPGLLISGFEMKHVLPIANILGLQLHHQMGGFSHDLILHCDTEFYPFYDVSPAYIASYSAGSAFRIGGGVNFYHLIPIHPSLTSDKIERVAYIDTVGPKDDTTYISFAGTKVMVNAMFDVKALFGESELFGPEDLKLYGEAALLGINNSKPYKETFGDNLHRMPMMLGVNLPAFNLLDRLSLEVQWYGAKFKDDLENYTHTTSPPPSPLPVVGADNNYTRDNWKWSLYGAKVFQKHIKLSFQVANDHFRPGIYKGDGDNAPPQSHVVMAAPTDWYWMGKLAYFF